MAQRGYISAAVEYPNKIHNVLAGAATLPTDAEKIFGAGGALAAICSRLRAGCASAGVAAMGFSRGGLLLHFGLPHAAAIGLGLTAVVTWASCGTSGYQLNFPALFAAKKTVDSVDISQLDFPACEVIGTCKCSHAYCTAAPFL